MPRIDGGAKAPRRGRTPHDLRLANFSPDGRYLAAATTCTRVVTGKRWW
ncbi:MAG TPA: hypothetical protein VNH11_29685 [Pirellulales bacterium]|nr:hypothetical protein [Pirellulales bacterium]HVC96628.1 hypothetical protein [Pirellulales bacterium]